MKTLSLKNQQLADEINQLKNTGHTMTSDLNSDVGSSPLTPEQKLQGQTDGPKPGSPGPVGIPQNRAEKTEGELPLENQGRKKNAVGGFCLIP